MPVMMEKLALPAANVPDEKARAAAVEIAEYRESISDIRSTLRLRTWILSFNAALIVAVVGKLIFTH
jgi:hypothetical protein